MLSAEYEPECAQHSGLGTQHFLLFVAVAVAVSGAVVPVRFPVSERLLVELRQAEQLEAGAGGREQRRECLRVA